MQKKVYNDDSLFFLTIIIVIIITLAVVSFLSFRVFIIIFYDSYVSFLFSFPSSVDLLITITVVIFTQHIITRLKNVR